MYLKVTIANEEGEVLEQVKLVIGSIPSIDVAKVIREQIEEAWDTEDD